MTQGRTGTLSLVRAALASATYLRLSPALSLSPFLTRKIICDVTLAAYSPQLRSHYEAFSNRLFASNVSDHFVPKSFIDWFQERLRNWAESEQRPHAYPHVFRKTALKRARIGEDRLQGVADYAKLSASVLIKHYAPDDDDLMRQASNRMFLRLVESLPAEVARRYGHTVEPVSGNLVDQARTAWESGDWRLLSVLSAELAKRNGA